MHAVSNVRSVLFACLTTVAVAACSGTAASSPRQAAPKIAGDNLYCPMAIPGTSVVVEDTATGGALVFVTTGDVTDLRARVAAIASTHNDAHGKMGPLPTGDEPGGMGHGAHDMHAMHDSAALPGSGDSLVTIHSQATSDIVDGGIRLKFISTPAEVAALREQLRQDAQVLAQGSCGVARRTMATPAPAPRPAPAPAPAPAPEPEPEPDPAALLAAETAAYEAARPVFNKNCAGCHVKDAKPARAEALKHFDMTAYPFGGHHAFEVHKIVGDVLGVSGKKPYMPPGRAAGSVTGADLALIVAWIDAFEAAAAAGAHPPAGHHGH